MLTSAVFFTLILFFQQPAFRVDADYIKVPVTVLDQEYRPLMGLSKDNFKLFDEGERRTIENFVIDESPVHVVFLLDCSSSIKEEIEEIKYATLRFAHEFDADDRIAIVGFSDEIELIQDWTNKYKDLRKSLKKLKPGYRTALYDALFATASEKLRTVPGKKVIILLTDGLDNESETSYSTVFDELIGSNTVLYIISRTRLIRSQVEEDERVEFLDRVMKNILDDEGSFVELYFKAKESSMNRLAETNGGRVFYPDHLKALGLSYMQIARELKNQYVLTFLPPKESKDPFRKIEVTCDQDAFRVFHREVYKVP